MPSPTLSSATRILKRLILFAIVGIFMGAIVGIANGVLAGAMLGCLAHLFGINAPSIASHIYEAAIWGTVFGGHLGIITGAASGLVAWAIVGVMQWRRDDPLRTLRQTMRGSLRVSLIMTAAGALCGTAFHSAWFYYSVQPTTALSPIKAALAPFDGGFFFGSIAGCAAGILLGAVLGARPVESWFNAPLRR